MSPVELDFYAHLPVNISVLPKTYRRSRNSGNFLSQKGKKVFKSAREKKVRRPGIGPRPGAPDSQNGALRWGAKVL